MIDTLLNLMFRCSHRRLTRPVSPISKAGAPHGEAYVVCLDCGKQFSYDLKLMRMGKVLDRSHEAGVLHPDMPAASRKKLKVALLAGLPLAVLVGTAIQKGKTLPKGAAEPSKSDGTPEAEQIPSGDLRAESSAAAGGSDDGRQQ